MSEVEAFVTGRVQQVMFRDFVQRNARRLGLSGYVENCPDGSVHLVAQGDEASLKEFIGVVEKGKMFARVDDVSVKWGEPQETCTGFSIKYHYV